LINANSSGARVKSPNSDEFVFTQMKKQMKKQHPGIKVTETQTAAGLNIDINCTAYGLPISKTSRDFGMDCANDCGRKAFEGSDEQKLMDMLAVYGKWFVSKSSP